MPTKLIPLALFVLASPLAGQADSLAMHLADSISAAIALADSSDYVLRAGDRVSTKLVSAAGDAVPVVDGERIVDRHGDLYLPFVGSVRVAGLDEGELRETLVRQFSRFYADPVMDVSVELRVNVTGSVGLPGQYFLDPTSTLIDAISRAGGMASEFAVNSLQIPANPREVRLVRDDGTVVVLNMLPGEIREDVIRMRVRSGDWINVPARSRSAIRDEITFWGSVVSFASSAIALIFIISR